MCTRNAIHTHTRPFNGPFSGTTQVSRYQKGKTNLDFTEARDGEWKWHQLGHMQVCTSLQTDNHTSTPPLCFLQAGCPSCHPTNSVKALKAYVTVSLCILRAQCLRPLTPPMTSSAFDGHFLLATGQLLSDMELGHWVSGSMGHLGHLSRPGHQVIGSSF